MKARVSLASACAALATAALVTAAPALAEPAVVGPPSSIASTGDSITRAFNTCWFPYVDCPSNSWSTGTASWTHYRRILAANPAISGRTSNHAVTGADMADLSGQVQAAVARRAAYVTILMGANDVCAASEASMTPTATFRAQLEQSLATLSTGLPDARIFISSIPDIYQLFSIYRFNLGAVSVWSAAGICQSMLANPLSNAAADVDRRVRVRQRNVDYNTQLAAACALYVHCRFDGNAGFNTAFVRADVTTRDYFHPSVAGQSKLAGISWSATFDFRDVTAPSSFATTTPAPAGTLVTLAATDNAGVAGIEIRLGAAGWTRYNAPVTVASGVSLTWRAVDVNGNSEATKSVVG
jgi:lysophospholipase L1-like esterase